MVTQTERLLELASQGDAQALEQLLSEHRPYLRRLIELRLDDDLHARVDPSDVVQETQIVAVRRIDEFLKRRPTSFRLWLRSKALEKLVEIRRGKNGWGTFAFSARSAVGGWGLCTRLNSCRWAVPLRSRCSRSRPCSIRGHCDVLKTRCAPPPHWTIPILCRSIRRAASGACTTMRCGSSTEKHWRISFAG